MPEMNSVPTRSKSIGEYPGLRPSPVQSPKLLDRLREALRSRHYSRRTEQTYCHWVKRFIYFHNLRHPAQMAEPEINAYLTHLAVKEKVSASTQNQALSGAAFPLPVCAGPQDWRPRRGNPCAQTRTYTRGDDARRGKGGLGEFGWRQMADGFADVRRWAAPDGMPAPAGSGHRLRPQRDSHPGRQGCERPNHHAS